MLFYYLNGTVAAMEANLAVVDCGGVGYACYTTSYTQSQLAIGRAAKLYTYCSIREDAVDIFGFSSREEKNCFERLVGVTGVGPKAALAILSSMMPEQFTRAVVTGDEKALTAAPGVGKKLAQRILLELKDKLAGEQIEAAGSGVGGACGAGLFPVGDRRVPSRCGHRQSDGGRDCPPVPAGDGEKLRGRRLEHRLFPEY